MSDQEWQDAAVRAIVDGGAAVSAGADPDTDPNPMRYFPTEDDLARMVALATHVGTGASDSREMVKRLHYSLDRLELRLVEARAQGGPSVIDVERLAEAMDNLFERQWGKPSPPLRPGSTTFAGAYAEDVAAEYARLAPEPSTRTPGEDR